jgi:hypothetical protein
MTALVVPFKVKSGRGLEYGLRLLMTDAVEKGLVKTGEQ